METTTLQTQRYFEGTGHRRVWPWLAACWLICALSVVGCERSSGESEDEPAKEASEETGSGTGDDSAGSASGDDEPAPDDAGASSEESDGAAEVEADEDGAPEKVDVSMYMDPVEPREKRVAIGHETLCILDDEGQAHCVGQFESEDFVGDDTVQLDELTPIDGAEGLKYLAAGERGVCGLSTDGGILRCWGAPAYSSLMEPKFQSPLQVVEFPEFGRAVEVEVGNVLVCLVRSDGRVDCFGTQVENGLLAAKKRYRGPYSLHRIPDLRARDLSCTSGLCCAVSPEQSIECWGDDTYGELGRGRFNYRDPLPRPIKSALTNFVDVEVGHRTSCALTNEGHVYCWGPKNEFLTEYIEWQDGRGPKPDAEACEFMVDGTPRSMPCATTPYRIEDVPESKTVVAGATTVCALTESGDVWCWGYSDYGVLGRKTDESQEPTRVDIENVDALYGRYFTVCALKGDALWCWGARHRETDDGLKYDFEPAQRFQMP